MNKTGFFQLPINSIQKVDAETLRQMVAASSDFVLLLSPDLVVRDVFVGAEALISEEIHAWQGHRFTETLSGESMAKFEKLLQGAQTGEASRWRQVNHRTDEEQDLAISYSAVRTEDGSYVLLGRDKREVSLLQQRLVQAQITIEQDYERIRQVESRYRVLFETGTDALVILSADTGKIMDANTSAARLLESDLQDLPGRAFANKVNAASMSVLEDLLTTVRTKGGQKSAMVSLKGEARPVWLDALLFRSVSDTLILCRLRRQTVAGDEIAPFPDALLDLFEGSGDAIVFTDVDGAILRSNTAFQTMTSVAVADRLRDESLSAFLGRPTVDLNVMTDNARRTGRMSVYATTLRSEYGAQIPVEISTTYLPDQLPPGFGFIIRDISRLEASRQSGAAMTTEAVEHVIELVGSTPLKELVRSTTDVVEKLCIETAIRLTNNNRAAAAEMLGLSRQSLYVKLRRYGLADKDE